VSDKVLVEIHRILLQNGDTKDIFRQLDGFLVLMSVLSNVRDYSHDRVAEPEEEVLSGVKEITSGVFMCMSEAMNEHPENAEYFQVREWNMCSFSNLTHASTDYRRIRFTH
jgi:hypothetical protein